MVFRTKIYNFAPEKDKRAKFQINQPKSETQKYVKFKIQSC